MTIATHHHTHDPTLRHLLGDVDAALLGRALAGATSALDSVAARVPGTTTLGRGLLAGELGKALTTPLDQDVTSLIAQAWLKHRQAVQALESTRAQPGTRVLVPLHSHSVAAQLEVALDVVVSEVIVTTVSLVAGLTITGDGIVATFAEGELAQVHAGDLVVESRLTLESVPLATGVQRFSLPELYRRIDPARVGDEPSPAPDDGRAVPDPTAPLPGTIVNGHRWTGREWVRVTGYQPGDIANGHRLSDDGRQWLPLPTGPVGARVPQR